MKIEDTKELFLMKMFMDVFQKNLGGDSPAFAAVLQSMSNALDGTNIIGGQMDSQEVKNLYNPEGASILSEGANNIATELNSQIKYIKQNIPAEKIPSSIDNAIKMASAKYGVEESFIRAVIKQESSFDPYSKSMAGAMGLMQLMPGTAQSLGVTNPYSIEQNVDGGTKYLKGMLESFGNCKELALAAYNAGPNGVKRRNVKSVQDINKMPSETRNYVSKVMKYYKGSV